MQYFQASLFISSIISCASARAIVSRDQSVKDIFAAITPSTSLIWQQPCLTSFQCAVLGVPLSYTSSNGTRAYVPLIKRPATTTPSKGLVLTNPGGPGQSGVDTLISAVPQGVFDSVPTNYDLVSWDPRGVGYSIPSANCSLTPSSKSRKRAAGISGPQSPELYFDQSFEQAKAFGQECQASIGGADAAGPHMTTRRNVTNPSILNYWGFSYGTTVGQEFASMYPERVGHVVIDGVVNPYDYTSGSLSTELQSTDAAFATFFTYCHLAGPSLCPFSTGHTAHAIYKRWSSLLAHLDPNTAIQSNWTNATTILSTFTSLKSYSRLVLYSPITDFPNYANLLVSLEAATASQSLSNFTFPDTSVTSLPEWLFGVACSDNGNVLYNKTLADLAANQAEQITQSYIGGEIWETVRIFCTGWSIKAEERYAGPFGGANHTTKNPILFVSNIRDPITPIYNGRSSTKLFPTSHLLTIDSTGHTSQAALNKCANAKIYAYFQDGTLSSNGKDSFCPLEAGP